MLYQWLVGKYACENILNLSETERKKFCKFLMAHYTASFRTMILVKLHIFSIKDWHWRCSTKKAVSLETHIYNYVPEQEIATKTIADLMKELFNHLIITAYGPVLNCWCEKQWKIEIYVNYRYLNIVTKPDTFPFPG